jgi:O-antigen ligase
MTTFNRVLLAFVFAAAGLVFGYFALFHQSDTLLLLGGAAMIALAILAPRFLLLAAIPLVILGEGLELTFIPISWPIGMALLGSWGLGVLIGRWKIKPREHLLVALLALLLFVSYQLAPRALGAQFDRSSDLISFLIGLSLLAAAISIPVRPKHFLYVTSVTGAAAGVVVLQSASDATGRVFALTLNPNYVAMLLTLGIIASVTLIRLQRNPVWLLPAVVAFLAMLPTGSRGAGIALAIGLLSILLGGQRRSIQVVLVAVLLGTAVVIPWQGPIQQRILSSTRTPGDLEVSDSIRLHAAGLAVAYTLDKPLVGIGYGLFAPFAIRDTRLGLFVNTHNDYLRISAEAGIPALLALLALIWLGFRKGNPEARVLRPMMIVYCVALLSANTLSNIIVTIPFWIALGTCLRLPSRKQPQVNDPPSAVEQSGLAPRGLQPVGATASHL